MQFLKNMPHYNHFSGEGTRHWDTINNYQHIVPATNGIYCSMNTCLTSVRWPKVGFAV